MSRVAQLDSTALDQELHGLFCSDFTQNINPHNHKEEYQLLLESLVFFFGAKSTNSTNETTTYGSNLSGVKYRCKKRTLYLIMVLSRYLDSRISHILFSNTNNLLISSLLSWYRRFSRLYATLDLVNFAQFLLSTRSKDLTFLSPLHRLLRVSSSTDVSNPINFYHNTVYAGIEFQNRQLLWNAILELFNATLLNNARWLNSRPSVTSPKLNTDMTACPKCSEFPTNPYQMTCCKSIYCYVCAVKTLEWSYCCNCNSTRDLSAKPIY